MQPMPAIEIRAARHDLVILVVVIVGLGRLLNGPLAWPVAGLLLAAALLGSLEVLSGVEAPESEAGVPIESLILPSVAAIGCFGAVQLIPIGVWLLPALAGTALLVDRTLVLEQRILRSQQSLSAEERSSVLIATLLVAFVAFVGTAALVPGGLAGTGPGAGILPSSPLSGPDLLTLALADAFIAGLLGYRAAALRVANLRDALWSAATYAIAIAIAAAALRAMAIPRLIGPALLTLAFYLWDAFHGASPSRRRDPRWIWQIVILFALGALVTGWNLLIRR